jgi:hypothetical protein
MVDVRPRLRDVARFSISRTKQAISYSDAWRQVFEHGLNEAAGGGRGCRRSMTVRFEVGARRCYATW